MTRDELLLRLKEIPEMYDTENAHIQADEALLAYINDAEISVAWGKIDKWFA